MAAPSAEIQFAQRLAGNEKKTRDKALKKLRKYIKSRSATKTGLCDDDLIKLWKGLHYCMWMQDKPLLQEELAVHISRLLFSFPTIPGSLQFFKIFLITEAREWNGIDRLRLDKFMMLFRQMLNQTFVLLKQDGWKNKSIEMMSAIINSSLLDTKCDNIPDGICMHLADTFLPELTKVGWEQLNGKKILSFLKVFDNYLKMGKRKLVLQKIFSRVYETVAQQTRERLQQEAEKAAAGNDGKDDTGTENEADSDSGYDDDSEPRLKYDCAGLSDHLFKVGGCDSCCTASRQRIYNTVKLLKDAASGTSPPSKVTVEEFNPDEDIDAAVQRLIELNTVKKMKRKRKLQVEEGDSDDEGNDNEEDTDSKVGSSPAKDSEEKENTKKKRKNKKKKRKLDSDSGAENKNSNDDKSQTESDSPKKKRKKNKKKKKTANSPVSGKTSETKSEDSSTTDETNTVMKSVTSEKKKTKKKKLVTEQEGEAMVSPPKKQKTDSKIDKVESKGGKDIVKTPKNRTPKSSKKGKEEVTVSKTMNSEKVKLKTPNINTPKSLQKAKLKTPKSLSAFEVHQRSTGKLDKNTTKSDKEEKQTSSVTPNVEVTESKKKSAKKSKTPSETVTPIVNTPQKDSNAIRQQLFKDKTPKSSKKPVSDFDAPLEEGEVEIWVPSKKYQKKMKAANESMDTETDVKKAKLKNDNDSEKKVKSDKKVKRSSFAKFESVTPPPAAFVKRAMVKTPTNKGNNSVKSTPQMTASEKKVKFNLKRNSAQKFEDSINISPLPAFLPNKSPSQGILKTPVTPVSVKMSDKKKKKAVKTPTSGKKTPNRSRAADFF